jgi:hypothetical protein
LPLIPEPTNLLPVGGVEAPKLPAPPSTPPALPALPAVPPVPGGTTPPVTPPKDVGIPTVPPPPELGPLVPPPAPKGSDKTPDPVFPPLTPMPATPVPPAPKSDLPLIPPVGPDMGTKPPIPPVGPDMGTKPPGALPPIEVTPKAPGSDSPGIGTPTGFNKPAGTSEAKPVWPESQPKTGFDVDLYDPKAGDTYEAISQEFYNDRRFAAALRAYNRNQPLQGGRLVEVPPIHILRKRFPAQIGAGVPAPAPTATVPVGASTGPNWGPAGPKADTPPRATGRGTFLVPQGGMTLQEIARQTGVKWDDIYALNPQHLPGTVIPAGTELKMP